MSQAKHPYTLLKQLQWMLSALAIVVCLYSTSIVHYHETGFHAAETDCISCNLEEVTAHGSILSKSPAHPSHFVEAAHKALVEISFAKAVDIVFEARAPPLSLV